MKHRPVLLDEVISSLNIKPNGIYVDLTLGGGGHSLEILKRLSNDGFLYGFDQDQYAINIAKENLKGFNNFKIFKSNFKNMKKILNNEGVTKVDGVLLDLGLSSFQIDDPSRGFSYMHDALLDMRMDSDSNLTAKDLINTLTAEELERIFRIYGEEKNSYKIAREIVKRRPLNTTFDLVEITDLFPTKGHSAKRVFQALRIYLNKEIEVLEETLPQAISMLNKDGVIAVISFHSLEDRIVKNYFKELAEEKVIKGLPTLPQEMPMRYGEKKSYKPTKKEIAENSRSASAILRTLIKN